MSIFARANINAINNFLKQTTEVRNSTSDFSNGEENLRQIVMWIGELIQLLRECIRFLLEKLGVLADKKEEIKQEISLKESQKKDLEHTLGTLESELNCTPKYIMTTDEEGNYHQVTNPEYLSLMAEIGSVKGEICSVESEIKSLKGRLAKANSLTEQINSSKNQMESSINQLNSIDEEIKKSIYELNEYKNESDKCSEYAIDKLNSIIKIINDYLSIKIDENQAINGNESGTTSKARASKSEYVNYINNNTHELSIENAQSIQYILKWSELKMKKCTMSDNGTVFFKTDCCNMGGKISKNGVPYVNRIVEINGIKIAGVFPVFDSAFDVELDKNDYTSTNYARKCNEKLLDAINNNENLKSRFTEAQIAEIKNGDTPTGYVWHHNEEPGKMQLVAKKDHDRADKGAAHTGGNSLWGPDSVDTDRRGEIF